MQSNFYNITIEIDQLLKEYTPQNLDKIELYFERKGVLEYFFKRLAKVSNPFPWLVPLKERGFFNPDKNPKPQEVQDKPRSFTIPHWNVLDYLEDVANKNMEEPHEEITNTLKEILDSIIDYRDENGERVDNYMTDWSMVKIISTLPIESIEDKNIEFIRRALKSTRHTTLVAGQIGESVLPRFLESGKYEIVINLLEVILDYDKIGRGLGDEYKSIEYISIMENYWLHDTLKKYKKDIYELCGLEAVEVALTKIKSILKEDPSEFNYIWIPTIENHPQRSFPDRYEIQLVDFVRDYFELANTEDIRQIVKDLLNEDHPIFKRIAIHAINFHYSELNDLFWNWKVNPLSETFLKHELYELLKKNCSTFSNEQLDKVLEWIDSKDFHLKVDIEKDRKERLEAYGKRGWLTALLKLDNPKVKEKYEGYSKIDNVPVEHPGFYSWTDSGWIGDVSPISSEDLIKKTNSEIAEYLKSFEETGGWRQPSKEGLSAIFRKCVIENPEIISIDLEPFLNVQRIYQHSLIWGFLDAWNSNKNFDWKSLLNFIHNLLTLDEFWREEFSNQYNYRHRIISMTADLIGDGTKDDNHAFDPSLLPKAEEILLILADKTESDLQYTLNFPTSVLNSNKGKVFSTMIKYSLRYARLYKKQEEHRWKEEIKSDFEKRLSTVYEPSVEFPLILGQYLPNLYYLDKKWVIKNINRILTKDNLERWKPAMDGYLFYSNLVYKELYDLLKENNNYLKAIQTDFESQDITRRVVEHISVGYLEDWEDLEDKSSLIYKLIEHNKPDQISEVIAFFWMKRENVTEKIQLKIKPLWRLIFDNLSQKEDEKEYQNVLSDLSKWISLVDEIDDDILKWAKLSARYIEKRYNETFLLENLLKHVENTPGKVGEIFIEMLSHGSYPYYKQGDIETIVKTLYEKGEKEYADRICNMYGERGYLFLKDLYNKFNQ
ncbi:MAG: hypothetical protein ACREOW_07395 [Thermodesulfobacteriota bacterium]